MKKKERLKIPPMVYAGMNFQGTNIGSITQATVEALGIDRETLLSPTRLREVVEARQIAMYVTKLNCPKLTLAEIGFSLGGKDHATVLHAIKTMKGFLDEKFGNDKVKAKVNLVLDKLRSNIGVDPNGMKDNLTIKTYSRITNNPTYK